MNNVGVMGAHFMPYLDMEQVILFELILTYLDAVEQEEVEKMIRVNTITAAQVF